jgi:hypothetical protein
MRIRPDFLTDKARIRQFFHFTLSRLVLSSESGKILLDIIQAIVVNANKVFKKINKISQYRTSVFRRPGFVG